LKYQYQPTQSRDSKDSKEARDEICRGYEFALEHMGMDIESTQLWVDYLAYMKDQKVSFGGRSNIDY